MKKLFRTLLIVAIVAPMMFMLVACGGGENEADTYKFSSAKIKVDGNVVKTLDKDNMKAYVKSMILEEATALIYTKEMLRDMIEDAYYRWEFFKTGIHVEESLAEAISNEFYDDFPSVYPYAVYDTIRTHLLGLAATDTALKTAISNVTTADLVAMLTDAGALYGGLDAPGVAKLTEMLSIVNLNTLIGYYDIYEDALLYGNEMFKFVTAEILLEDNMLTVSYTEGGPIVDEFEVVTTINKKTMSAKYTQTSEGVITSYILDLIGVTATVNGDTIVMVLNMGGGKVMEVTYIK